MMKIAKLRLKNFKSFKSAEIPFSDGYTAIAGSNGSGKSNILDAILFGLGITSMKLLRASRLSDLVNNNAVENYAKVDVVLKDGDKTFEIGRMIDRQGKSVFRLNEEKKTLDEIASMLEEMGVKPTGHNVVVQGDITKIVEMSPEERRKIVDNVAGLQEYDEKKEEALHELDKVEVKIKEASIVMKERENYLEELEAERNAAMQYDKLVLEKKQSKATLLHGEIAKIDSETEKLNLKKKELLLEKSEKESKITEIQKEQFELRDKIFELEQKILQSSEQTYAGIGMQIEGKKNNRDVLFEKVNSRKGLLDKNNAKINSLSEKEKILAEEFEKNRKEFDEMTAKMPEIEKKMEQLQMEKLELEKTAKDGMAKEQNLENDLSGTNIQLNELMEKYYSMHSQIDEGKKSNEFKRKLLEELELEKRQLEKRIVEKKAKDSALKELLKKHSNPHDELNEVEKLHEKVLEELKEMHAETKQFHEAVSELKREISACPVCDKPLNAKIKAELLSKKESNLSKISESILMVSSKKKQLEEKRLELKKTIETKHELEKHLHNFEELLLKDESVSKKITEVKASLSVDFEKQKRELDEIRRKIDELEGKRKRLELELDSSSEAKLLKKLNGLSTEINSLELEKSVFAEKKSQQKGIEGRQKNAIVEMKHEISALEKENHIVGKEVSEQSEAIKRFEKEIKDLEIDLQKSERHTKQLIDEKNGLNEKTNVLIEKLMQFQQKIKSIEQQENDLNIEKSKFEVRLADLQEEFREFAEVERFREFDAKNLQRRIFEIEKKIAELGAINMKALEAYDSLKAEVNDVKQKAQKLEDERLAVLNMIEKIEVKRTNVFMDCFGQINKNFNEMFYYLFEGEGLLSLNNEKNPLDAGLMIEAKHKGEKMKNIDSMSGGEKSLTALAFIFAIQLYDPSPFYIFDEADAALDDVNSEKLAKLITEISKQSQFISITHNPLLIKKADQLIGVALNEQKSSVIGLKLKEKFLENAA